MDELALTHTSSAFEHERGFVCGSGLSRSTPPRDLAVSWTVTFLAVPDRLSEGQVDRTSGKWDPKITVEGEVYNYNPQLKQWESLGNVFD